jgi:Mor family transcriptional regulator
MECLTWKTTVSCAVSDAIGQDFYDRTVVIILGTGTAVEETPMKGYENDWLTGLERQLTVSPSAVRQKYADRIEALLNGLKTDKEYSRDYIYFRITGFRPEGESVHSSKGTALRRDLGRLLERISEASPLPVRDAPERVFSTEEVAQKFSVSERTVLRWREKGLVCRKYVFDDGRTRLGVRRSELNRFSGEEKNLLQNASSFSRVDKNERDKIRELGRTLVREKDLSLSAVAEHVAQQVGRARETVRRILKHADLGDDTLAATGTSGRLQEDEKRRLYRAYRNGSSAASLAERFNRSPSTVYRLVNQCRARDLLDDHSLSSQYVLEPEFQKTDAQRRLAPLSEEPAEDEVFRLYNFIKFRLVTLKGELDPSRYVPTNRIEKVEKHIWAGQALRCHLLADHLRIVLDIARQHSGQRVGLSELLPEGIGHFFHAVDAYHYRDKGVFPHFARLWLLKAFARTVPESNYTSPAALSPSVQARRDAVQALLKQVQLTSLEFDEDIVKEACVQFGLRPGISKRLRQASESLLELS